MNKRFIYIQSYDQNVDENLIRYDVVFQIHFDLIDLLIFVEMEEIHDNQSCYFYQIQ
jgi:hypothetical protein